LQARLSNSSTASLHVVGRIELSGTELFISGGKRITLWSDEGATIHAVGRSRVLWVRVPPCPALGPLAIALHPGEYRDVSMRLLARARGAQLGDSLCCDSRLLDGGPWCSGCASMLRSSAQQLVELVNGKRNNKVRRR
jgi:hypothetical protein